MNLTIREGNRWYVAESTQRVSLQKAQQEILQWKGVATDFCLAGVHVAPVNQTYFKVYHTGKEIVVAAALFDTATPFLAFGHPPKDDLEIFFDPYYDHLGYFQFQFNPDNRGSLNHHLPYPESHSTAFPYVELKDCEWETAFLTTDKDRVHWLLARFGVEHIFRNGNVCGFNVGRYRHWLREASSWNFCGGPGFLDPTSFGHLYMGKAPVEVRVSSARRENDVVQLAGTVEPAGSFSLELVNPHGKKAPVSVRCNGNQWEAEARLTVELQGRYRLYPSVDGKSVEPQFFQFDVSPPTAKRSFHLGMTWDFPDNFCANHYTPERLGKEMRLFADWGIDRIYWIDYDTTPSFWDYPSWKQSATRTFKACGDLLPVAVKKAREAGMECYGIFKLWDIGFNFYPDPKARYRNVVDLDGKPFSIVVPPIVAHQEWTMQANPAWIKKVSFPVTELTLYSETPIRPIKPSDIRILVSKTNERFKPYHGKFKIRQGTVNRPHYRWSPAGKIPVEGTVKNWFVTLSGLDLRTLYIALQMGGKLFQVTNHAFTLAEAKSADGSEAPLTFSLRGDTSKGFVFGKDRGGWALTTEAMVVKSTWGGGALGITFQVGTKIPTLLEPSFEGTHRIWLDRVQRILDSGADGVDIRILCHHNGCSEWLRYAFAEPVRAEFRRRYNREVEPTEADYEKVRRIRGEFFTQFLRKAKKLTVSRGKKLAIHFEARVEVAPQFDTSMQIHWDWETWINEGIMDELTLKYWSAESVFIHEKVLPLARRKNIPVLVENQNYDVRSDGRSVEKAEQILREDWDAGMDGVVFYEAWGYLMQNSEGCATQRGIGRNAVQKASETLRQLQLRA